MAATISMPVSIKELKDLASDLSKITDPLAIHYPENPDDFTNILVGIYRKNKLTLSAIVHLCDDLVLGGSALDLLRSMLEDMIGVEWMIHKGKEEQAKKFKQFLPIQVHLATKFAKELDTKIEQEESGVDFQKIEIDYQKAKNDFTKPSGDVFRSWNGLPVEKMMVQLHGGEALDDFERSRLTMAYTFGSWKNHLNPFDIVMTYLSSERIIENGEHAAKQALFLGSLVVIRLTQRYLDELRFAVGKDIYQDIADKVQEISNRLASMG